MKTLSAVWHNGQVVLNGPAEWPEGCRLIVQENQLHGFDFMTEDEQNDDPHAIQRWIDDLQSTPAFTEEPAEQAARLDWNQRMRRFNIEAVRKQFEAEGQ